MKDIVNTDLVGQRIVVLELRRDLENLRISIEILAIFQRQTEYDFRSDIEKLTMVEELFSVYSLQRYELTFKIKISDFSKRKLLSLSLDSLDWISFSGTRKLERRLERKERKQK